MVDHLSLSGNVLTIVQLCAMTVDTIGELVLRYKNAPHTLQMLYQNSLLVHTFLEQIQSRFLNNPGLAGSLDQKPQLRNTVDTTLTGCLTTYKSLHNDLRKVTIPAEGKLDWKKRGYIQFNDDTMDKYLQNIQSQLTGLKVLLDCLTA